ncbi:hypothetical protein B0H13DRAFT_2360073 [Mycena leptocephala]|nr:hypothetical protein B0H13DRAFT_2360073 [Mycena leptocephala]
MSFSSEAAAATTVGQAQGCLSGYGAFATNTPVGTDGTVYLGPTPTMPSCGMAPTSVPSGSLATHSNGIVVALVTMTMLGAFSGAFLVL